MLPYLAIIVWEYPLLLVSNIIQGLSRLVASGMRLLRACFWTSEVPKGFFGLPRTGANYL